MNKYYLIATLFVLALVGETTEASSWGLRKRKKMKSDTTTIIKDSYSDWVKKAETRDGMLRIHRIDKDWYFEISDSVFNRDLLIVNKVSGVPYELNDAGLNKGMSYEDKMIRFRKDIVHGKVWVTTWNPRVSVPEGDAIARSVKDNYREAVIEQFPIERFNSDCC